jgi:hypothetical protein
MRSNREMFTALVAAGILLTGCQPSNDQVPPDTVPQGAIPAAPDVRPGAEPAPAGEMSPGTEGVVRDPAMPADTARGGTAVSGVDTVGMQRP